MDKDSLQRHITAGIRTKPEKSCHSAELYRHLVRRAVQDGRDIGIWSDAIDAALREGGGVYLPAREEPYYLDRPIILSDSQCITADPAAKICAVTGLDTCLVQNRQVCQYPDDLHCEPDRQLSIAGGTWSAGKQSRAEVSSKLAGHPGMSGAQGTFIFTNIRDLVLTDLKFEKCSDFAIQISHAENVFVSDLAFDVYADGVHLNGPLNKAVIQNLTGQTGDDFVALNAWDWVGSAITFGPIENVLLSNLNPTGGHKALRFLAGVKTYPDATTRDCPIQNVLVQKVSGVNEFKLYAQPEPYLDRPDGCVVGKINDLYFEDIDVTCGPEHYPDWNLAYAPQFKRGVFEILANIESISFAGIRTDIAFAPGSPALIDIGPKSATLRAGSPDPRNWREVFLPDGSCVVETIVLSEIQGKSGPCTDPDWLVHPIRMTVNKNYPAEVPKGGTGCGQVRQITFR